MSKKYYDRLAQQSVSGKKFECDFGLKVLKKFGWSEGKGLGKNEDGTEDCVQIKKREKDVGLGGDAAGAEAQWDNWWSDTYNSAAKKMTIQNANKEEEHASSSDSEGAADGGRVTAVKNASRMKGKLARIVRQEGGKMNDDSDDSDSDSVGLSALAARVQAKRQEKGLAPVIVNKIEKLDESWAAKAVGTKQQESDDVIETRTEKIARKRIEVEDAGCEETTEAKKKSKKIKVVDEDGDTREMKKEKKSKKKNNIEVDKDVNETRETKKFKKKKKSGEGTESE
eukprot:GEMP01030459.1.p2 GENE.GEMP01030459.1~~GEMP01030459.1.p2  ORF type:complete len:283 (+),score=70.85 GEMP01030459.1:162-1010(+)